MHRKGENNMIEDKEAYIAKRNELLNTKESVNEAIDIAEAYNGLLKEYYASSHSDLMHKLELAYDDIEEKYNEFIKEETETFEKITKEFSANQIECWIAQGYDTVDMVNAYLRGDLEKFKEKPNEHK